jgi:hypothetical protein
VIRRRLFLGVVAGVLSAGTPGLSARPRQQQPVVPTFRSAVDLLTIEASVRDHCGVPAPDLQSADFTVTIDGRPRRVVSAQFFKTESSAPVSSPARRRRRTTSATAR